VTIAVLAIICAMAIPSFTSLIRSNRLSGGANEVVAAFQAARSEAVRLNGAVALCRSEDGATCTAGDAWTGMVIVDRDGNLLRTVSLRPGLEVTSDATLSGMNDRITFNADGLARDSTGAPLATTLSLCLPVTSPADNIRRVVITGGSRISITRDNGGGACTDA